MFSAVLCIGGAHLDNTGENYWPLAFGRWGEEGPSWPLLTHTWVNLMVSWGFQGVGSSKENLFVYSGH